MKRIITLVVVVLLYSCSTKNKAESTKTKEAPAIEYPTITIDSTGVSSSVFPADTLVASDIYTRLMEWRQKTYKNPSIVLKGDIENEMIRLRGELPNGCGWVATYQIDIKDYRYKVSFSDTEGVQELSKIGIQNDSCFNNFAKLLNDYIVGKTRSTEW
jgi:hypothetical protein